MAFLKGKFVKKWDSVTDHTLKLYSSSRDTLIDVSDIKRLRACEVDVYDTQQKKVTDTICTFVVTAVSRSGDPDETITYYAITDPVEKIAEVSGRDVDELSALLLEIELKRMNK